MKLEKQHLNKSQESISSNLLQSQENTANSKGKRILKILPKYFSRRWNEAVFPEIRLAGKWLQDIGFICGKKVNVKHEKNKIIITLDEEQQG